jgi:hypothetical protein
MKFDVNYYLSLKENALDNAIEYGLDSIEYAEAISEMQFYYKNTKKSFTFKLLNLIERIKWQVLRKR